MIAANYWAKIKNEQTLKSKKEKQTKIYMGRGQNQNNNQNNLNAGGNPNNNTNQTIPEANNPVHHKQNHHEQYEYSNKRVLKNIHLIFLNLR